MRKEQRVFLSQAIKRLIGLGLLTLGLLTLIWSLEACCDDEIDDKTQDCGKVPKLLQLPVRKSVSETTADLFGRCNLFFTMVCLDDGVTCDYNNQCCKGPCNDVCGKELVKASAKSARELEPDLGSAESIIDDAFLEASQIIVKYGYPFELHEVTTDDGYILSMHRIPYGRAESEAASEAKNKRVIWLQHGLLGDSSTYMINTPDKALAYLLADLGYDVWIGNIRGSRYSKKHVKLTSDDHKFWEFCFDEMGKHDVPAILNYILNNTGQSQLDYVGHSMGNAMFFIAMIEYPELNSKVRVEIALAPAAYNAHMKSPILNALLPVMDTLLPVLDTLENGHIDANSRLLRTFETSLCKETSGVHGICMDAIYEFVGSDKEETNATMVPMILGHFPGSASVRTFYHYGQSAKYDTFSKFHYGEDENVKRYGTSKPPAYDLSKVTVPVAVFYGNNDMLVPPEDVQRTAQELGNVILNYQVPHDAYTHMDFLWAKDNDVLLNNKVLEILEKYK